MSRAPDPPRQSPRAGQPPPRAQGHRGRGGAPRPAERSPGPSLRKALAERVVIADGAMGSMLQGSAATLDDFAGHEGCNEILNLTRPDIVRAVHDAYLAAGVDCVSTNTFGANLGNL